MRIMATALCGNAIRSCMQQEAWHSWLCMALEQRQFGRRRRPAAGSSSPCPQLRVLLATCSIYLTTRKPTRPATRPW
jgi:hypothetical protein